MSHVPLSPIGSPRSAFLDDAGFADQRQDLVALEEQLLQRRQEVHAGWGEKYVDRVHKKGKLTARERIERLKDPGTRVFEVGTFVNHGVKFGKLASPGAGVVTAFVRVEDRWCMVIANDNTVASGAWWPKTPEKIEKDLMKLVPREEWTLFSHWLIWHGRRRCPARRPDCGSCEIGGLCPSATL